MNTMRFLWDWDFTDSLWNWRNRMPTSIKHSVMEYSVSLVEEGTGNGIIEFTVPLNIDFIMKNFNKLFKYYKMDEFGER